MAAGDLRAARDPEPIGLGPDDRDVGGLRRQGRRRTDPEQEPGDQDQGRARLHLAHRILDQLFDLFGRRSATPRQVTDLGRHHRKTAALFARTRRLDRGVERQQLGLLGNL